MRDRIHDDAPAATLARKVYNGVKQQILSFELLPGTQLQELSLCKAWGVSRTPVREALAMLEAEGLVEHTTGKSYSVAQIRRQEMFDAYEVRLWIEPKAAAQAAKSIDEPTLEELRAVAARMPVGARSREKYSLAETTDIELHRLIVVASGNRVAHDFVMQARQITRRASYMVPPARFMWSQDEHAAIINAIADKNSDLAERLMRLHIEAALERYFGLPIERTQVVGAF